MKVEVLVMEKGKQPTMRTITVNTENHSKLLDRLEEFLQKERKV